jgi:hypothetical protein
LARGARGCQDRHRGEREVARVPIAAIVRSCLSTARARERFGDLLARPKCEAEQDRTEFSNKRVAARRAISGCLGLFPFCSPRG